MPRVVPLSFSWRASCSSTATPLAPSLAPMTGLLWLAGSGSLSAQGRVSQWASNSSRWLASGLMTPMMFLMPTLPPCPVFTSACCTMTVSQEACSVVLSQSAHLACCGVPGTRGPNSHCWRVSSRAPSASNCTMAAAAVLAESPSVALAVLPLPVLPQAVITVASTIYNNVIFITRDSIENAVCHAPL